MAFEYEGLPSLPTINTYPYTIGQQPYESHSESYSESSSPDTYQMRHTISPSESTPYTMLPYGSPQQVPYFAPAEKIPLEYIDSSSLETGDRRDRRAVAKGQVSTMHLRRRAQNRASQRAFRERKEKHVKGLESQLQTLHEQYQNLLQSYNSQANEVDSLKKRVQELMKVPNELQYSDSSASPICRNGRSPSQGFTTPTKFELPPFTSSSYPTPEPYFDKPTIHSTTA
ncbi:hypothetical protein FQN49_007891 [Arthroderma sp. PD_2]|nr:hypothetical protein FQN49_007891 [Arthroderma sp. PD_2]